MCRGWAKRGSSARRKEAGAALRGRGEVCDGGGRGASLRVRQRRRGETASWRPGSIAGAAGRLFEIFDRAAINQFLRAGTSTNQKKKSEKLINR